MSPRAKQIVHSHQQVQLSQKLQKSGVPKQNVEKSLSEVEYQKQKEKAHAEAAEGVATARLEKIKKMFSSLERCFHVFC